MWLYSIILISSISIPFILSFDNKLQFYKQWKVVLPSLLIVALFYIVFDIYFLKIGVWGFNPRYHLNILIFGLPLEEWLFFVTIPYASIFLHESLLLYFPHLHIPKKISSILTIGLIVAVFIVVILNLDKAYTAYNFIMLIIALLFALFDKTEKISSFYITFLVILIPFIVVNSLLTGSFIDEEVVWYNNSENLGIRFLTIPIEDFGYAFSLILFNLLLIGKLKTRTNKNYK
jgi:lycopene cyclase domain-containing protein